MKERTLVILKPDCIQRGLIGEVIKRIERVGLKIVAMKTAVATEEQVVTHYNKTDEWFLKKGKMIAEDLKASGVKVDREPIEYGKDIIRQLVKFMTAGPVICMVVEGNQSVAVVTKLVGSTEPATSDVGTIRGDFTVDSYALCSIDARGVRNLVHCSESPEEAQREIPIWFAQDEVINYRLVSEAILYDVNLDGILE